MRDRSQEILSWTLIIDTQIEIEYNYTEFVNIKQCFVKIDIQSTLEVYNSGYI